MKKEFAKESIIKSQWQLSYVWFKAPRLSWPQTRTGRETFQALNFWTIPAIRQFRPQIFWTLPAQKVLDKSGPSSNLGTSPAARQVQPWSALDKSSPEAWDKSGPETCPALRQVILTKELTKGRIPSVKLFKSKYREYLLVNYRVFELKT